MLKSRLSNIGWYPTLTRNFVFIVEQNSVAGLFKVKLPFLNLSYDVFLNDDVKPISRREITLYKRRCKSPHRFPCFQHEHILLLKLTILPSFPFAPSFAWVLYIHLKLYFWSSESTDWDKFYDETLHQTCDVGNEVQSRVENAEIAA